MSWYVAVAKNGRALRAVDELIAGPTCVLCPIERYEHRVKGRRFTKERPLLGRYLLIDAEDPEDLIGIRKAAAGEITGFVSDSRGPLRANPVFVDQLLQDDAEGVFWQIKGHIAFKAGDRVRITAGPFAEMVGELKRVTGSRRWQIFLDSCFLRMPVTQDEDLIEHEIKPGGRAA